MLKLHLLLARSGPCARSRTRARPGRRARLDLLAVFALLASVALPAFPAALHAGGVADTGGERPWYGAFFKPAHNLSHSASESRVARTSPRSLALDPNGRAFLMWHERITHTQGTTPELAIVNYWSGTGWDSLFAPVAWWDGNASTEPACAIDYGHNLHMAWIDRRDGIPQVYVQMFSPTRALISEPLRLSLGDAPCADVAIAAGADGSVHVVWAEIAGSMSTLRHCAAIHGRRWLAADSPALAGGAGAFSPDLAVDDDGVVHLVWEWAKDGGTGIGHAAWSWTAGWSPAQAIEPPVDGRYAQSPVVAVAGDRSVVVAWAVTDAGGRSSIMVRRRDARRRAGSPAAGDAGSDAGSDASSWQPAREVVDSEHSQISTPSLAIDAWGTVHLVWEEDSAAEAAHRRASAIRYCALSPVLAPDPRSARSLTALDSGPDHSPMVAVDSSGRIFVAWVDDGSGHGDVWCREGISGFARPPRSSARPVPPGRD